MLEVFFTVDVEVWCDGWDDLDSKFPSSFQRYIYGPQCHGGLPTQLQVLSDHGLTGVCFVEPLFAGRFGLAPLAEIVGLIDDGKLRTRVGAVLPLADAREAHLMLEGLRPQPKGKIVLTIGAG